MLQGIFASRWSPDTILASIGKDFLLLVMVAPPGGFVVMSSAHGSPPFMGQDVVVLKSGACCEICSVEEQGTCIVDVVCAYV